MNKTDIDQNDVSKLQLCILLNMEDSKVPSLNGSKCQNLTQTSNNRKNSGFTLEHFAFSFSQNNSRHSGSQTFFQRVKSFRLKTRGASREKRFKNDRLSILALFPK